MSEILKTFFTIIGGLAIISVAYMTGEKSGYEKAKKDTLEWLKALNSKKESEKENE